jgi:sugar phosphate isomerase/epimerase
VQLDNTGLHLTYCTNIHAADGWPAVDANLRHYAPALKDRLSPEAPFGIGLRLSARDARELLEGDRLEILHTYLQRSGLYVALINGFPYGPFHGTPVKAEVYAPDWQSTARLDYTLDLVRVLRQLLPAGVDGGVSTAPLTYKAWMRGASEGAMEAMTRHVVQVAAALIEARQSHGAFIHLDIEPEPDCLLETSSETIAFFERWLLPIGVPALAADLGISKAAAEAALRDHVQVCFDCCHFAVEYEDPDAALASLQKAGLEIGRVQLSSALDVPLPADPEQRAQSLERLRSFADSTYLHQVIERHAGQLCHFPDLGEALTEAAASTRAEAAREWRIHFHVPLFTADYEGLQSTQGYVAHVIDAAARNRFTNHLEIETYTWDVLPHGLKVDLLDSIRREYEWVLSTHRAAGHGAARR